ncbi:MAG: hypothetical protein M0Q53_12815 [Prolixibacteraceae bacterium]|jgi:hypothetical protein|nr:hypothetical protein [Prolixibacteraceae bacterium]
MKKLKISLLSLTIVLALSMFGQPWHPAGDHILTKRAENVIPQNPLPEYPRPILVRSEWQNLNGLWNYAILTKGQGPPAKFDAKNFGPFRHRICSLRGSEKCGSNQ